MATPQSILPTDTLEAGFRSKYNQSINAIIVSVTPVIASGQFTGVIRLVCFDGSFINLDLTQYYYTQTQITQLVSALTSSPYYGEWNSAFQGGYPSLSVVDYDGNFWRNTTDGNTVEPGLDSTWIAILDLPTNITPLVIPLPAASAYPLNVNTTNFPAFGNFLKGIKSYKAEMSLSPTQGSFINDVKINLNYTDNTKATLASIDIYGHDSGDGATTIDNLTITLYA